MKVFKNRISKSLRGQGGKGDVDINYSLLNQPDGYFLQSTDFVKSLDLICEGEIEGFVNNQGENVKGFDILEAITLDDTPILERNEKNESSFNFQNVSVDYRLGSEIQSPIEGFQNPTKQKEINFGLLGKFLKGVDVGERALADPLFEEYDEEVLINEGTYDFDEETVLYTEIRKYLRLTGLNIYNPGDGYTAENPVTVTFSDLGNPKVSGGQGTIYDAPLLTIVTDISNQGGILNYTINDSGRFQGSYSIEAYSGQYKDRNYSGSGTFYNFPTSYTYETIYTGSGTLNYYRNDDGIEIYPSGTGTTGIYSGNILEVPDGNDLFDGYYIDTEETIRIDFAQPFSSTQNFTFTVSGEYFAKDSPTPFFEEVGVEPTYLANFSPPEGSYNGDDIRNGINFSNWNDNNVQSMDAQSYTHIVRNSNIGSVSAIIDIKRLNDTLHKADTSINVTDKPGLFGGTAKADVGFRIGNPTDSFVEIKIEWGFLNTNLTSTVYGTYAGQTINGYLSESQKLEFNSYKTLQEFSSEYADLTIEQLKTLYPKFIRVSKNMYETDSALINRDVLLHSIKEYFDTELTYPSSALVATEINSTYFDQIPKRKYDLKLKKIWVPETYNIRHKQEDKRFRKSEISSSDDWFTINQDVVWNPFSRNFSYNTEFGTLVELYDGDLFVMDTDWGSFSQNTAAEVGQVFIYENNGKKDKPYDTNASFPFYKMIRDGIPVAMQTSSSISAMSNGYGTFPVSSGGVVNDSVQSIESVSLLYDTYRTIVLTYIRVYYLYAGYPMSITHPLFLRISPKKFARLKISLNYDVPNSDYIELARQASGVVIGTVSDLYAQTPETVLGTVGYEERNITQEIDIYNPSETEYIYVKFFGAQLKKVIKQQISVPEYGVIIEWPALGNPVIVFGGLVPDIIDINTCTLTDTSLEEYDFKNSQMMKSNGRFLAIGCTLTELSQSGQYALLVLEKDKKNGLFYKLQDLRFIDNTGYPKQPITASFSGNKLAVLFETNPGAVTPTSPQAIVIYNYSEKTGLFELEDSFRDFEGFFDGLEVYGAAATSDSEKNSICFVDSKTIIIKRLSTLVSGDELDSSTARPIFVYRRNSSSWALDQIIVYPTYKEYGGDELNVDAIDEWLVIGAPGYGRDTYTRDSGTVFLYKYNGQKYELFKQFFPKVLENLNEEGGPPTASEYIAYFGHRVKISLNDNLEPIIVATATREITPAIPQNITDATYIIQRNPHSDEWSVEKIPLSDEVLRGANFAQVNMREEGNSLAFDGKNIAFSLVSNVQPDSVGTIKISSQEKSSRLYTENAWFGLMKKSWSDNPAWIIYDLLTNPIYGAGTALDNLKDINIFNFYQVSKYFDSCDENGYYLPIYDEKNQTEPRLSCNFLLDKDYNAFEVISAICDLFFGGLYIKEGKYNIWADMPTAPSWYFSNNDVLDGNFSYNDSPKNERPSIIKVPFLDKHENFKEKIEFVEDSLLIRENGKIEKELDFVAFITRSQARRFGKQYLYNKSYETEKVFFETDDRALFLNPGDVVGINDEIKNFENAKLFWNVADINHKEKIYGIQYAKSSEATDTFLFSEITISNGDTDNFDVNYIEQESSNSNPFYSFDINTDNSGVPYIFGMQDGSSMIYKKSGETFQEVFFQEGSFYSGTSRFMSNLEFDSSNNPHFSIIEGGTTEPVVGFIKFTGTDFENTTHWQKVPIEALDPSGSGWTPNSNLNSIIKIADNDEKYIFTFRDDISPDSGEYLLYHYNGIGDDSNQSSWDRYLIDSFSRSVNTYHFDMKLVNNNIAIAYTAPATSVSTVSYQIRYKEFNISGGILSVLGDVFVAERDSQSRADHFYLSFDKYNIPYISHTDYDDQSHNIYSPLSYSNRFDRGNWAYNQMFLNYGNEYSKLSVERLQDGKILVFNRSYSPPGTTRNFRSLQFYELSDIKDWSKQEKWQTKTVFKTAPEDLIDQYLVNLPSIPSTAYYFNGPVITLDNSDNFLFNGGFFLNTNIRDNLEIINLSDLEVDELYEQTQFERSSIQIRENIKIESQFLTATGYNISGNYINVLLERGEETAKILKSLKTPNPLVRPIGNIEKYKEYRVLNIKEKDANLYEIEAREYHSGKFDIIDSFGSMPEPKEAEYNIGLPTNVINRPPEPLGVSYQTGIDDGGSPFLTGQITGEINGNESEYRLSVRYPNGRFINKEIEKDGNNLSPLGNPLTDFSFYNLSAVGDYELTVKSLRNPESSDFVNTVFTINQNKDKISTYPFLQDFRLSTNLEIIKVKVSPKNVYGDSLNLSDSICRINIKIDGETWISDSKLTEFETSFQQVKDLTNTLNREREFKAELAINGEIVSEIVEILADEPPKINKAEFISDGSVANIFVDISEKEKLKYLDLKTGDDIIKTFVSENQNQIQYFNLDDFEINNLPKKEKIMFSLVPRDFYGTGSVYQLEGFIPEKESVFEQYTNSIFPIYSIYSNDEISSGFFNYNSSNDQTGFYGNGENCLIEFSSSLVSGNQATLNLQMISDEEAQSTSLNFSNQGFLSTKKILKLSKKYYNIDISGQNGLFDGFELKIKKLV